MRAALALALSLAAAAAGTARDSRGLEAGGLAEAWGSDPPRPVATAAAGSPQRPASDAGPREPGAPIIFAVGTSTFDTGLLDDLLPPFEARTGVKVKVLSVGTGQALALAERGEADLTLTHSPEAEERFMARGLGVLRRRLMRNDFVIVGPAADPARVREAADARSALASMERARATFVSRGDESGTHLLEEKLWAAAGLNPKPGPAYLETGQGQAATLRVASQKGAYALTDRGTFTSQRQGLELVLLFDGDPVLRNVYHLIVASPRNGSRVNVEGAQRLIRFLLSPETLGRVREFGRDRFGQALFIPDAEPYGED